ncbi:hypothetical protein IV454_22980 [Massilia antarctica]|uniref:Transposase DDE domain-containing protein n=1 Tax=Massilia antarctica TaxID=2765360 RepID=A0AA49A6L3_9BURK|nr:hypothetical protein [Massilia antarctica]QPI48379.1 hypothetical protein IV454_22980 [Massilia antarctica]
MSATYRNMAQMGGKALRSMGLARATLHLNGKVAAYNLQRLAVSSACKLIHGSD